MQIDRSNYEIWFIDWLDGNLNSHQAEQLKLFLDQNQDLQEELNDLTPVNLVSPVISFRHKEQLKKSPSDISPSQFEYLCAAYLENDLTNSQQKELKEIVNSDPDRKKRFDLIQQTILSPARISYKHKSLLLKRTTVQKVIRLSVIGLSAAAAITLIIILYSVLPGASHLKPDSSTYNPGSDSTGRSGSSVLAEERITRGNIPAPAQKKIIKRPAGIHKEDQRTIHSDKTLTLSDDSLAIKIIDQKITVNKVPACTQVDLGKGIVSNKLIASNPAIKIPDAEDKRGQAGRFISKTFREILLKEKTPSDNPLTGYEIAEAGVAGLNKLFGWQMALGMKNDDRGQPKSVNFTSQILKVNAPVKKREPQP